MAPPSAGDNEYLSSTSTVAEFPPRDQEKDVERGAESTSPVHDDTEPTRRDADVVDWDGPDDPANPLNWSFSKKTVAVGIVSAITFISPLASSILAPGIPHVMADFNSTNEELASFIVSVYLVGYCFGPLIIAPLSEIYGRAPLYHVCNVLFVIFSIACAVAPNLAALVVFRFFAGLAGSCPMAIGPASIADLVPRQKRGKVMAAYVFGPLLGPVLGPIG
ncbi:transporter [Tolypocladium capitatum]|uniref:Transporter n=1 Tax=Tolypocladium capitatum TaxID=45235 RepID=A0A2K3QJC0_9HYPO|nr:transporter [Tolypocladium capitatum]